MTPFEASRTVSNVCEPSTVTVQLLTIRQVFSYSSFVACMVVFTVKILVSAPHAVPKRTDKPITHPANKRRIMTASLQRNLYAHSPTF